MDRNFYIILAAVIGVLAFIFVAAGGKEDSANNDFVGDPLIVQADDYVTGEGTSGVTIIEYADFACPGCAVVFTYLDQLKAEFGDEVKVVFRHFPLERLHPNAIAAHRAATAAGNQGAFWEMHDLLYSRAHTWTYQSSGANISQANSQFQGYAQELGLDLDRFNTDVAAEETFNRISTQIDSGNKLGVNGTPTIYLNGEEVATPPTYDDLRTAYLDAVASVESATQPDQTTEQQPAEAN